MPETWARPETGHIRRPGIPETPRAHPQPKYPGMPTTKHQMDPEVVFFGQVILEAWGTKLTRTYTRELEYKFEFRIWAAFGPNLAPRPLQAGQARQMV